MNIDKFIPPILLDIKNYIYSNFYVKRYSKTYFIKWWKSYKTKIKDPGLVDMVDYHVQKKGGGLTTLPSIGII